jgi:excinuclease ABC subunit B
MPSWHISGAARRLAATGSKVHKPDLDEMGIALYHERVPHRPGDKQDGPRKPTMDEMARGWNQGRTGRRRGRRRGGRGGWKLRGK